MFIEVVESCFWYAKFCLMLIVGSVSGSQLRGGQPLVGESKDPGKAKDPLQNFNFFEIFENFHPLLSWFHRRFFFWIVTINSSNSTFFFDTIIFGCCGYSWCCVAIAYSHCLKFAANSAAQLLRLLPIQKSWGYSEQRHTDAPPDSEVMRLFKTKAYRCRLGTVSESFRSNRDFDSFFSSFFETTRSDVNSRMSAKCRSKKSLRNWYLKHTKNDRLRKLTKIWSYESRKC